MAMKRPTSTEHYIEMNPQWEVILVELRDILLSTGMDEHIKWMFPCYSDKKKNIASIGATKNYVGVWFFQGALLKDELGVLQNAQEGKTKAMRQWRFTSIEQVDRANIEAYLYEAIENQRAGREIKPKRKPVTYDMPTELQEALESDEELKAKFYKLSPSNQRDYADHIGGAKREETRLNRLERDAAMILEGKGLNDKYRK